MPNSLAYLMLALWPAVSVWLFLRLSPARALIWSLLGAYLVLPPSPAAFDFPLMPPLSKSTLPNLTALLICLLLVPRRVPLLPDSAVARGLIALYVLSPALTVLTNGEPVVFVQGGLPGLRINDAIALPINQFIVLVGFLLARPLLRDRDAQRDLLLAFLIGGLVYSLPMLLEVRLSPQLNLWVYGYYQYLFEQSVRGDGFRPVVFLFHGIWAAFFVLICTVAAITLWRFDSRSDTIRYLFAAAWLAMVLVLAKTLAPLAYLVLLTPLVIFTPVKLQLRVAAGLAVLALSYPILKGADLVPDREIAAVVERFSPERANSLSFRIDNEDILLERAREKPLFGWGSWGRNHVHNPVDGTILTVTDGRWIITIGVYGILGYLAEFGLLTLPLFLLWRESRYLPGQRVSPFLGPLSLLLGVNMIDLLPNATLTPMTWLVAGALLGHAEQLRRIRLYGRDELIARRLRKPPPVPVQTVL